MTRKKINILCYKTVGTFSCLSLFLVNQKRLQSATGVLQFSLVDPNLHLIESKKYV